MSYITNYNEISDSERQAVIDCLEWLGSHRFKELVSKMKVHNDPTVLYIIIDFFGIRGYPATAMINRYTNA